MVFDMMAVARGRLRACSGDASRVALNHVSFVALSTLSQLQIGSSVKLLKILGCNEVNNSPSMNLIFNTLLVVCYLISLQHE